MTTQQQVISCSPFAAKALAPDLDLPGMGAIPRMIRASHRAKPKTAPQTCTATLPFPIPFPACPHTLALELEGEAHLRLMRFVEALQVCKTPARAAIRIFYEAHGIEDEDYDRDSAYRAWQRYRHRRDKKNARFFSEKNATTPSKPVSPKTQLAEIVKSMQKLTHTDLETIHRSIREQLAVTIPRLPRRNLRQLRIFVFHYLGRRNVHKVTGILGCSKWAVFRATRRCRALFDTDTSIREAILHALRVVHL